MTPDTAAAPVVPPAPPARPARGRALEVHRSLPRYLATRTATRLGGALLGGSGALAVAPLRLVDARTPQPPRPDWVRVGVHLSGICGSDLATVTGQSSLYFSPLVSMPFVPGHEVVGELLDATDTLPAGTRVVLDPVLGCAARGESPCPACRAGQGNRCERVATGHLAPGLQTGYCRDTGGGWGSVLVAHPSQLHPVPDALPDEIAVLVEPLACAVHTARRAQAGEDDHVLVLGAGAVGLFTTLALRRLAPAARLSVVAKHPRQKALATLFGADDVWEPGAATALARRATGAVRLSPERGPDFLLGGVSVAIEATGSPDGLATALRVTRAGGRVVLSGLPTGGVDLTPAWFRELDVVGTYATGGDDFAVALELATDAAAEGLLDGAVGGVYPLARYADAIDHARNAGRLGTLKVAFDPRSP